jgi:hypothetical protein
MGMMIRGFEQGFNLAEDWGSKLANKLPNFCHDIEELEKRADRVIDKAFLPFKKFVAVTSHFTEMPSAWASTFRKVNEFTLPYLFFLANCPKAYAKIGVPLAIAFEVADLGELWNDFNYFLNEAHKDLNKTINNPKSMYVAGRILSAYANLVGTAAFLKAADLASTLGEMRLFSFVERAATFPLIRAIPGLTLAVKWLSEANVVLFLASYGNLANWCLLGAFALFELDSLRRLQKCHKQQMKDNDQEKRLGPTIEEVDDEIGEVDGEIESHELKHIEIEKTQAKYDAVANAAELLLRGVVLGGVASQPVLFVLGTFAFLAYGNSAYYRNTTPKTLVATPLE